MVLGVDKWEKILKLMEGYVSRETCSSEIDDVSRQKKEEQVSELQVLACSTSGTHETDGWARDSMGKK